MTEGRTLIEKEQLQRYLESLLADAEREGALLDLIMLTQADVRACLQHLTGTGWQEKETEDRG